MGELADLKKKHGSQLASLKELFPSWAEDDLLFALEETDGDLERTVGHISEGNVSQFSDVRKKTKDRARSKAKEPDPKDRRARRRPDAPNSSAPVSSNGPRGERPTRGRSVRPRGGGRGGRGGVHASDDRQAAAPAAPADPAWGADSTATWDTTPSTATDAWDVPATKPAPAAAPAAVTPKPSAAAPPPLAKATWANMLRGSTPVPATKAPEPAPVEGAVPSSDISSGYVEVTHSDIDEQAAAQAENAANEQNQLPPSEDPLTKHNVEHLPDSSHPAPTGTAASTVDSSRAESGPASVALPAQPAKSPIGMTGFATSAYKAMTPQPRSASFQRRLLEQQEAVVLPEHAVDRAAVQFGSLGLNGDIDEDREEAETRAQPPQHSPVAQPRASLPQAPRHEELAKEADPPKEPFAPASLSSQQSFMQFSRYGTSATETAKPHDPFGQQSLYPQAQAQAQSQAPTTLGLSAAADYSQYYTADAPRNGQYYPGFGPQSSTQQTATPAQPRAAFAGNESSFTNQAQVGLETSGLGISNVFQSQAQPQTQPQTQQSRFTENQPSGHAAPNPQLAHHQAADHVPPHSQGQHAAYPYGQNPYYQQQQPYYQAYMNQYTGYNHQGFGAPFAKGNMYQPHHAYGMPQGTYEQNSSTPAVAGSFGDRNAGLSSEYGRSSSAQPAQNQHAQNQHASSAFNADVFGRSPGNFPAQAQQFGQQAAQADTEGSLKPFDKQGAATPASSIGQPGRPTSATNNASQTGAAGTALPPPQSQHQGFSGYPGAGHLGQMQGQQGSQGQQQSSQYAAALGGLGNHQQAQQAAGQQAHQYGSYGSGFGNTYNYGGRGGWSTNYSQH
jgi:hypothetical protein